MIERNQCQQKPDLKPTRYLIINPDKVLDAVVTPQINPKDDLLIQELEEGIFSVLKDGKRIIEDLHKLTNEHGYSLGFYSNRKEHQILHTLKEFDAACERELLKNFPRVSAMILKRRNTYLQVRADDDSSRSAEQTEILDKVSQMIGVSKSEWDYYIMLDNRPSFNRKAIREGWNMCDLSTIDLKQALRNLCQSDNQLHTHLEMQDKGREENFGMAGKNTETSPVFFFKAPANLSLQDSKVFQHGRNSETFEKERESPKGRLESETRNLISSSNDCCLPLHPVESEPLQVQQNTQGDKSGIKIQDKHDSIPLSLETRDQFVLEKGDWHKPQVHQILKAENRSIDFNKKTAAQKEESKNEVRSDKNASVTILNDLQTQPHQRSSEQAHSVIPNMSENKDDDDILRPRVEASNNGCKLVESKGQSSQQNTLKRLGKEPLKKISPNPRNIENIDQVKNLISNMKFEAIKGEGPGGSSFTQWFNDEDKRKWVGKCSFSSATSNDCNKCFDEFKEYVAGNIYHFFGVKVPETALVWHKLSKEIRMKDPWKDYRNINVPHLHIMSNVVPGFNLLGEKFINQYINASKTNKKELFKFDGGQMGRKSLRGFGRVMAVAVFVHDYDFIGNSGRNIGCIPSNDGKYFDILKIDPGEGLTPEENLKEAKSVHNPLEKKDAVAGTQGKRINFVDLNEIDRKEYIETLKEILEARVLKLKEIFLPFLEFDSRFRTVFEELLKRRKKFLVVFSDEVSNFLDESIKNIEEHRAQRQLPNWGKLPLPTSSELKQKSKLLRNKTQLEAFAVAENANFIESKVSKSLSSKKDKFVGRDIEFSQIKKVFNSGHGIIKCAVVGGAGLGKSQLAAEYLVKNQKIYSQVVWLHAEQNDLIIDQMQLYLETWYQVQFAPEEKDKKAAVVKKFYQILGTQDDPRSKRFGKKSCIVFDNADSLTQITDYLPDQNLFPNVMIDILITSRYKNWRIPKEAIIEVHPFGTEETKRYIRANFPDSRVSQSEEQLSQDAENLCNLLGGLPLAISLAVAFIQQSEMSLSNFCEFIGEESKKENTPIPSPKKESSTKFKQNEEESAKLNIVSTILTLALADLRAKDQNVEDILDILAYLCPDHISLNTLKECWAFGQPQMSESSMDLDFLLAKLSALLPEHFREKLQNVGHRREFRKGTLKTEDFDKALELLISYSMVTLNPRDLIRNETQKKESVPLKDAEPTKIKFHQLTQQVIRLSHQRSEIYDNKYQYVFDWVFAELEFDEGDVADLKRVNLVVPHGIHIATLPNKVDEVIISNLFDSIGYQQRIVGNYNVALEYANKSLVLRKKNLNKAHSQIEQTLRLIGQIWGSLGDYLKELDFLTQALKITEKRDGKYSPQAVLIFTDLGSTWRFLGDFEKAKDSFAQGLELSEKHFGKDNFLAEGFLLGLGSVCGAQGNHQMQLSFLNRSLKICEKYYGKDHPRTAGVLNDLSLTWEQLGEYEKQKEAIIKTLKIREKYNGKDHPETGLALSNVGNAWINLGNYDKAIDCLARALEIIEKCYGKKHLRTGITLGALARAWGSKGYIEKRKDLLMQALEAIEGACGKGHPESAQTLYNLANTWMQLNDYEKAKNYLTQSLCISEKHMPFHPMIIQIKSQLSLLNMRMNLGSASSGFSVHQPEHRFETKSTSNSTSILSWRQLVKKYQQKEYLTLKLKKILTKSKTVNKKIIPFQVLAGNCNYLSKNYHQQTEILMEVQNIGKKIYGDNHPIISVIHLSLSIGRKSLKDYESQKAHLIQALNILTQSYGKKHPLTGIIFSNLASACFKTNESALSLAHSKRAYLIFKDHFGETHSFSKYAQKNFKSKGARFIQLCEQEEQFAACINQ